MDLDKTFIIGDIHGCLDMLKGLMERIDWDPDKDGLIFLGDYIDRGADPKGVVDFILELSGEGRSVQCLMGNHEDLFLEFLAGADPANFILNGGVSTMESYHMDGDLDRDTCEAFRAHLTDCAPCEVVVDNVRQTITVYKCGEPVELPPECQQQLQRMLRDRWEAKFSAPEN